MIVEYVENNFSELIIDKFSINSITSVIQHNNLSTATLVTISPVRIFLSTTRSVKDYIPSGDTPLYLAPS